MDILPAAPLQIRVTSQSTPVAEKLYRLVDAALARAANACCILAGGGVVVGALTEGSLESAIDLARTRIADLKVGSIEICYLDDPYPQEPFYRVVVTTPEDFVGDVIGDLNRRVGAIEALHPIEGGFAIKCGVPMAEMLGYDLAFAKMTRGHGKVEFAFIGYYRRGRRPDPPLPPAAAMRA
jgi:hypothetical protein